MKKIAFLCLALILLFVISLTVVKADIMAAQSLELKKCYAEITGTGKKATLNAKLKGNSSTKKITATIKLYQKEGDNSKKIKAWNNLSKNGNQLNVSKTCSATKGKTYKIVIEGNLSDGKKKTEFKKNKIMKK